MVRVLMSIAMPFVIFCVLSRAEKTPQSQIVSNDTIDITTLGRVVDDKIMIDNDVDLRGAVCTIPHGEKLVFMGGIVKNGILIGNDTRIEFYDKAFDMVTIQGTWNVPEISTELFVDLKYENSLRDVVALSNPNINNTIVIEEGEYSVTVEKESESCISLGSNTHFVLNGHIRLKPNNFKSYNILQATGKNILIEGNGCITGDKEIHTGDEGEWGMGIYLRGALNASVKGVTVKDCWGDCIYVGGRSRNVLIENCKLDNGRRQGISLTNADSVIIKNCLIMNVCGTNPQYAIDIEPNSRDTVDHVIIDNVEIKNCVGGIVVSKIPRKEKSGASIGSVTITNCTLTARKKYPLCVRGCDSIRIDNCAVHVTNQKAAMYFNNVQYLNAYHNDIFVKKNILMKIKKSINGIIKNVDDSIIAIENVSQKDTGYLRIFER